jgi:hypothetical protein
MSARDDVLDLMRYSEEWFPGSHEESEADIASELDAYKAEILHEAAEKIRNHPEFNFIGALQDLADLIDPEVA